MQRIRNFFKPSEKTSSNETSSLEEELEQMRLKRDELLGQLEEEQIRTKFLKTSSGLLQHGLDGLSKADSEINKSVAFEKQIERQKEEIRELEESAKDNEHFLLVLNEKKQTENYRRKAQKVLEQFKETKENPKNEIKPWKFCEVCDLEYEESEQRVPRVLACGHTLCHTCVAEKSFSGSLFCPFDAHLTDLKNRKLESLPKNFTVLHM